MTTTSQENPIPTDLQRGSAAEVIERWFETEIRSGRLAHGEQIEPTRTLATKFGTSVATITRAFKGLEAKGLVRNRDRSSRIVHCPPDGTAPTRDEEAPTRVVVIGGYAGSGKTELGRILARLMGWALLDKDTTTRAVVEAALESLGQSPHDRESPTYLETIRPAEYAALVSAMVENVECGVSVVMTAPFIRELSDQAWCDRLRSRVESKNAELEVIWVRCDAESMKTYVKHRGALRDSAKLSNWPAYLAGVDLQFTPKTRHLIIDNSVGARPLLEQASEFLTKVGAR